MSYNHRLSKTWEKKSVGEIVEDVGVKISIEQEDYVYWDENAGPHSSGRWRAGRLSKKNTGQIVSKNSAISLKGRATQLEKRLGKARHMKKQKNLTASEAWEKAEEWNKEYRKARDSEDIIVDPTRWADEQFDLIPSP